MWLRPTSVWLGSGTVSNIQRVRWTLIKQVSNGMTKEFQSTPEANHKTNSFFEWTIEDLYKKYVTIVQFGTTFRFLRWKSSARWFFRGWTTSAGWPFWVDMVTHTHTDDDETGRYLLLVSLLLSVVIITRETNPKKEKNRKCWPPFFLLISSRRRQHFFSAHHTAYWLVASFSSGYDSFRLLQQQPNRNFSGGTNDIHP